MNQDLKKQIRTDMLSKRNIFASSHGNKASNIISQSILENFIKDNHKIFSLYYPIKGEVDISSLMFDICEMGRTAALPVIREKKQPLIFIKWEASTILVEKSFGLLEPESGDEVVPDIMLVPLVAFDRRGNRLGYGGGYYDMTISEILRKKPSVKLIGIAYAMQEVAEIPFDDNDQKLHYIVTEKEIIAGK